MMDAPRIYVASLSDYNAGRLHGCFIRIDGKDADEIQAEVDTMLAQSNEEPAEEWAIHDYEGFGKYRLSEWTSFTRIALLGQVAYLELNDDEAGPFFAWLSDDDTVLDDYEDDPSGLAERFREVYRGRWDSFKDFVMESDYGDLYLGLSELRATLREATKYSYNARPEAYDEMVDTIEMYIDWDSLARTIESDGRFTTEDSDDYGVWVFEPDA